MEQVNPNILTDISWYSLRDHRAYPKASYILEITGFDIKKAVGSDAQVKALIISYTEDAWNILMSSKTFHSQKAFEYFIAVKEEYRLAFLKYVCSYIFDIYFTAENKVLETSNTDGDNKLTFKTLKYIKSGLLYQDNFRFIDLSNKVGY